MALSGVGKVTIKGGKEGKKQKLISLEDLKKEKLQELKDSDDVKIGDKLKEMKEAWAEGKNMGFDAVG